MRNLEKKTIAPEDFLKKMLFSKKISRAAYYQVKKTVGGSRMPKKALESPQLFSLMLKFLEVKLTPFNYHKSVAVAPVPFPLGKQGNP